MDQVLTQNQIIVPKKRVVEQDIAKGLCMVFIILLHSLTLFTIGGRDTQVQGFSLVLVCLFGYLMPFYMLIAGYNYKKVTGKGSYKKIVAKRTKQIIVPLFVYATLIWIILGAYMVARGEAIDQQGLFKSYVAFWIDDPFASWLGLDASRTFVAQALGPTWFLKSIYTAGLIFYLVAPFALENNKKFFISVISLLVIAVLIAIPLYLNNIEGLIWKIDIAPAVAAIMLFGAYLKQKQTFVKSGRTTKWRVLNFLCAYVVIFLLELAFPNVATISGGRMTMTLGPAEIFIIPVVAIYGTYVLLAMCRKIAKVKPLRIWLTWFGQRSMLSLIIQGAFIRVFCDVFGVTNGPNVFTWKTLAVFGCSLAVITLYILLQEGLFHYIAIYYRNIKTKSMQYPPSNDK